MHGVKLLGGPVSVDHDFSSALVMKRVFKTIGLLDAVAKINDPQCELLLILACAGISKLFFAMRTCPLVPSSQLNFLLTLLFVLPWSVLSRLLDRGLATGNGDSPHYPLHLGALAFIQQMALWRSQGEDHTSDWLHVRKSGKYMTKCTAIGYEFFPFSFSSLGELETYAVILLKRIRKFSIAQDIEARAAIHIFNRITFAIAK
nr:reverse transcriptase domain-containing protein [Tanacetum cinerariifolium]